LILSGEKRTGAVNVVLIGDTRMRTLNRRFRGLDRTTDVLSFCYDDDEGDKPPPLIGEVFISVPQAERRSRSAGHDLSDEILFLASHGLLHLLGYTHESIEKYERMIERQLHYLNALYRKR
jgi:rRNA maturation RNase YbeY